MLAMAEEDTELEIYDVPEIEIPDIDLPEIDLPDIEIPDIDLPEADVAASEAIDGLDWMLEHQEEADNSANLYERGRFALHQAGRCDPIPQRPVDCVRRDLYNVMSPIFYSRKFARGAWLFRHPPGVGKTTTFCALAKQYGGAIVAGAPTVAEAEAIAKESGLKVLYSQSPRTCKQLAQEARLPKGTTGALARHLKAGHRGSEFCAACPFREACMLTEGQYRYEIKEFSREAHGGVPRRAMTNHMLKYWAEALSKNPTRCVVWIDEDVMPHIQQDAEPIEREQVADWVAHAKQCGESGAALAIMQKALSILDRIAPANRSLDRIEDHETQEGRALAITAEQSQQFLALFSTYDAGQPHKSSTHWTERIGGEGETLDLGQWRPALLERARGLLTGVAWVHIGKNGQRTLRGKRLNTQLLELANNHAVLQSDATARPEIWADIWGKNWRGTYDDTPERSLGVEWVPNGFRASDKASKLPYAVHHIKQLLKKYPGKCGVLTFKSWEDDLVRALRAYGIRTTCLTDRGAPHESAAVVIGHYGRHDRATNEFNRLDVASFFMVGSYRVPMSEYHQRAGAAIRLGAKFEGVSSKRTLVGPTSIDGKYLTQSTEGEHGKVLMSADPRSNWVACAERAANLSQAVERVRSVDRKAKGKPSILVTIWGADACIPTIPMPITYTV